MTRITQASFIFIFSTLFFLGYLGLATPFLTVLFSLLALHHLRFFGRNWIAISLFLVLVALITWGFAYSGKQAYVAFPRVIAEAVPTLANFLRERGFELPYSDVEGFKVWAQEEVTSQLAFFANIAKIATKELVFLIIGLVVAISLFRNSQIDLGRGQYQIQNNVYSLLSEEIGNRFRNLYRSFEIVMGAQVLISLINTLFTTIFVFAFGLPYKETVVVITFLCGLLPIVGNILSNTVIVGIALTVSAQMAFEALAFLVILHKFEYFLNSKIIGGRIKNPMWLTLLGLIVGERLMGIPGMILAPVVLNYLKLEGSQVAVALEAES